MSPSGQTRLRTTIETGDLAMRAQGCRAAARRVSGTWMRLSLSSSGFPRAVTSSSAGRSSTLSITRTWDFRTRVGACLLAQMERRIPFAKAGVPLDRSRTLKPTREPCSSEQNSTSKLVLLCVEAGESCFRPFAGLSSPLVPSGITGVTFCCPFATCPIAVTRRTDGKEIFAFRCLCFHSLAWVESSCNKLISLPRRSSLSQGLPPLGQQQ
jgi:hypothetical protein